jgi:hypothetical protein
VRRTPIRASFGAATLGCASALARSKAARGALDPGEQRAWQLPAEL